MWQDPTLAARSLNNAYAQLYIIMDGSKMESITKVQTLNMVDEAVVELIQDLGLLKSLNEKVSYF